MSKKQVCILVLGMHRSGTSAFTGLLNILDVFIGNNLLAATKENEKGYFENSAIYDVNESLLSDIDSSWDDMFFSEDKLDTDLNIDTLKNVIKQEFKDEKLFAIKDPRLSYLFPFYKQALDELSIDIKVMIPYRNPLEVAKSLKKRNSFSLQKGMLLWSYSILLAEKFSRDYDRIIIGFDELINDTATVVEEMSKKFHIDFNGVYKLKKQEVKEFLEPNLKHHNVSLKEELSKVVAEILSLLESSVENGFRDFDKIREEFFAYRNLFYNKDILDVEQIVYAKNKAELRVESLGKDLKNARETVEQRDKKILKLNDIVKNTGEELEYTQSIVKQRDDKIDELNEFIKDVGEKLEYAQKVVEQRDRDIEHRDSVIGQKDKDIEYKDSVIEHRDKDIEHRDNIIINTQNTILELEEIAQSLRLKNRLKRVFSIFGLISNNPKLLSKVWFHLKRGNLKHVINKTKEKTQKLSSSSSNDKTSSLKIGSVFKDFDKEDYSLNDNKIDIVIPVYNGYEFLESLFDSIKKNTDTSYRLLVVNDASPDERVKPFLEKKLKEFKHAKFINNKVNLGFVKSVNKAVKYTKNHFVILNTDTEVPSFWLERLMKPIVDNDKIATTTPFTNSGTIASFPNFLEDNEIFLDLSVDELDSYFKMIKSNDFYEEVPTGVGFCMGVNKNIVKELGFFDEETFDKGYGEENDWCQRAIKAGYKNIMVPNLLVYHKHGGSFPSEEKKIYIQNNLVKLLQKHPNYTRDVELFIQKNPYKSLRDVLILLISSNTKDGVYLIIDHALGGGANHYADELILRYKQENKKVLNLAYNFYTTKYELKYLFKSCEIKFEVDNFSDLKTLLLKLHVEEIFVNELVSHKNIDDMLGLIKEIKNIKGSTLIVAMHDYFSICPNYTLLDDTGTYCDIPNLERCKTCMDKNRLEWRSFFQKGMDVQEWRSGWFGMLSLADKIVCFSESSKTILNKAYPNLEDNTIDVVPHTIEKIEKILLKHNNKTVTIGILGAINHAKGADIVKRLVSEIDEKNIDIKIVLIGEISQAITSRHFLSTGRYNKKDLPKIILKNEIDLFFIPSICPETFSYTTQEIISMQLPLMVFDLGAPAERVKEYNKGYIIDSIDVESVLSTVERFKKT